MWVDEVTGTPTPEYAAGAVVAPDRYVTRARPRKDAPLVDVEVDREELEREYPRWSIDVPADELRRRARAKAKRRKPRVRATFSSPREEAKRFMEMNASFFDPIIEEGDPFDGIRDFLDGLDIAVGGRRTKHGPRMKRATKSAWGKRVLEKAGRRPGAAIEDILTYLYGQGRGRWDRVPWGEFERLEEDIAGFHPLGGLRLTGGEGGITWYPVQRHGVSPEDVAAIARVGGDYDVARDVHNLRELEDRIYDLRQVYESQKRCLDATSKRVVKRRIEALEGLLADPDKIRDLTICGTDPSGFNELDLCGYDAVDAELRMLMRACELGYDPDWPVPFLAASYEEGLLDIDRAGREQAYSTVRAFPDATRAAARVDLERLDPTRVWGSGRVDIGESAEPEDEIPF